MFYLIEVWGYGVGVGWKEALQLPLFPCRLFSKRSAQGVEWEVMRLSITLPVNRADTCVPVESVAVP
jgi:hypothetical protein